MYCTQCGQQLPDGTRFCPSCGAAQATEFHTSPNAVTEQPQPRSAPLYTTMTSEKGSKPQKQKKPIFKRWWFWLLLILFVLFIVPVPNASQTEAPENIPLSRDEYMAQCTDVDYEEVARNPDNFKNQLITFRGTVIQVMDGTTVTMRIAQVSGDQDFTEDIWYATYKMGEGEYRILENDVITVYGECAGIKSYTSVFGQRITIPSISVEYYTR